MIRCPHCKREILALRNGDITCICGNVFRQDKYAYQQDEVED